VIYLFDIDGTLIAAHGAGRRAFEQALVDACGLAEGLHGIKLDGKTDPLILAEAFAAAGRAAPTDDDRARVFAAYLANLDRELVTGEYEVLPGVERALLHLESRGAHLGLQTGNLEAGARRKLEHGNLWHRFAFGGFGSDAHAREELVAVAIERGHAHAGRRVLAQDIWVLGDTPRDIEAAHHAGARAVGVATGSFDEAALRAAGADVVVPTLEAWVDSL
jgi:phosphoglycolate phosphatase